MKKALIGLTLLVAVISGTVVYVSQNIDRYLSTELSNELSALAGTRVRIDRIETHLLEGKIQVHSISIDNPHGFSEGSLLELGELRLSIQLNSLLDTPITVEEIAIIEPHIVALVNEQGELNLEVVADRLSQSTEDNANDSPTTDPAAESLLVEIDQFIIDRAALTVDLSAFDQPAKSIELPTLRIDPIGHPNGVPADEVGALVVSALLDDAKRQAKEAAREAARDRIREEVEARAREALDDISNALDDLFK